MTQLAACPSSPRWGNISPRAARSVTESDTKRKEKKSRKGKGVEGAGRGGAKKKKIIKQFVRMFQIYSDTPIAGHQLQHGVTLAPLCRRRGAGGDKICINFSRSGLLDGPEKGRPTSIHQRVTVESDSVPEAHLSGEII